MPTGTVDYFHKTSGYGFIKSDETSGDIFFHMTEVGEEDPEPDQSVEFSYKNTTEGLRATSLNILTESLAQANNQNNTNQSSNAAQETSLYTVQAESSDISYDDVDKNDRPIARTPNSDLFRATVHIEGEQHALALKEPRVFRDSEVRSKFLKSSQLWNDLDDHPHIITVFDWGTEPVLWLAVEYVKGGDLADRLDSDTQDTAFDEALWICECIADALQHLHHRGVAHLDIKPSNILFEPTENHWDTPKLTDLQLAKLLLRHSGSVDDYTPAYVAPEQVDSDVLNDIDAQTDLYQLGIILYELVVGEHPFPDRVGKTGPFSKNELTRKPPRPSVKAEHSIPNALDELIISLLSPHAVDRPDTARQVDEQLKMIRTSGKATYGTNVDPTATPDIYLPLKMAENLRDAREMDTDPVRMCRDRAAELYDFLQHQADITNDQSCSELSESLENLVQGLNIATSQDTNEALRPGGEIYKKIDSIAYNTERLFLRRADHYSS